jgi:hypothetical protein
VHAAGVEKEQAARVLPRIEQALGLRVDVDTAAGVAGADQVRVAVPDLGWVDTMPRGADEIVVGEIPRQQRVAGIPEALLGPEAARREAAGRGRNAKPPQEKSPSTQASS